ncbi:bacterial Ig-like domain-containing protein, partial [Listeria monocytogenes]|uniref:bacterial Ig-like domain-containing protein n=1 Tax=Listeria monocytogenes TaxID=1639 RepID=UPI002FDBAAA6
PKFPDTETTANYTHDATLCPNPTLFLSKKGVNAHDATIYVGDSWSAKDNFR